jgi:hypothetical protein
MNKKTKMYVGLGVVAVAAYYFWHKSQADKTAPAIAAPAAKFVGQNGTIGGLNKVGQVSKF